MTRDVSSESSSVTWLPALSAVEAVEAGEMLMLPPTYLTCLEAGQYPDSTSALAAAGSRTVDMFTPEVITDGEDFVLSTPPAYLSLMESR